MPKELEDFDKLVGSENYHTWAFAMKNYLDLKGLSGCISDPVTEVKQELLLKSKATLSLGVNKNLYVLINKCNTASDVWKTLKNRFEEKGHVEKLNGIGFEMNDDWVASIILAGLNVEFQPFIMALEASGTAITTDSVITK
jgi:hypothetical protein